MINEIRSVQEELDITHIRSKEKDEVILQQRMKII
jgi:hypothetical protein